MAYATANPKQTRESHFKHFFGAIDRLLSVSMRLCICHVFVRPIWMHATLMFDLLASFQLNSANILRCEKRSKKKKKHRTNCIAHNEFDAVSKCFAGIFYFKITFGIQIDRQNFDWDLFPKIERAFFLWALAIISRLFLEFIAVDSFS